MQKCSLVAWPTRSYSILVGENYFLIGNKSPYTIDSMAYFEELELKAISRMHFSIHSNRLFKNE